MTNPDPSKQERDYASMTIRDLKALLLHRGVDPSACVEKKELVSLCRKLEETDYDEEARKIFARMGLEPAVRSRWAPLDCIWRERSAAAASGREGSTDGGGRLYVGNYVAASTRRILDDHGIQYVVNCQDTTSENYFEDDEVMTYLRFPVARLRPHYSPTASDGTKPVLDQFLPAFSFIDTTLSSGGNVLVHCLAGAHRAGTVGVAYLMYKSGMGMDEALRTAKVARPVIGPFGVLMELLRGLERDLGTQNIETRSGVHYAARASGTEDM